MALPVAVVRALAVAGSPVQPPYVTIDGDLWFAAALAERVAAW